MYGYDPKGGAHTENSTFWHKVGLCMVICMKLKEASKQNVYSPVTKALSENITELCWNLRLQTDFYYMYMYIHVPTDLLQG